MANLRILAISGDFEDYSTLNYENAVEAGTIEPLKLWEQSYEAQQELEYNDNETSFYYKAHKFGDVDPKFIDFVESQKDYDNSKHNNFYIV